MSNHFNVEVHLGRQDPVICEPDYDNRPYCPPPQSGQQKFDNVVNALRTNQVDRAANLLRDDLIENPAEALRIARSLQVLSNRGQLPDSIGIGQNQYGRPDIQLNSQFGTLDIQERGVSRIAPPQPDVNCSPPGVYQPGDNRYSQPGYPPTDSSYSQPACPPSDNSYSPPVCPPTDNSYSPPVCSPTDNYPQPYPAGNSQLSLSLSFGGGGGHPFHRSGCEVPPGYSYPRVVVVVPPHHEPPHFRKHQ